jgi:hypothetical protein
MASYMASWPGARFGHRIGHVIGHQLPPHWPVRIDDSAVTTGRFHAATKSNPASDCGLIRSTLHRHSRPEESNITSCYKGQSSHCCDDLSVEVPESLDHQERPPTNVDPLEHRVATSVDSDFGLRICHDSNDCKTTDGRAHHYRCLLTLKNLPALKPTKPCSQNHLRSLNTAS